ncbi:23S rRNA (uracil(1939)-C(5))-methyltransferase RlmD [Marinilabiliaceae bacterium ANBcel2]|nr:23S rRNA (uracil(1939)-C(5))-methyltransferase RlmD [Marinilabiliaceae bacterium ANBcel2]
MGRSSKRKPLLEALEITDVAAEGKAIGRVEDRIVFVNNTVPGDVVDVQVRKKRRKFYEGYPVRFHSYSNIRTEPFCDHFGICGGCKWQALPYKKQLFYKQREVFNNLLRIGKVELPDTNPIVAAPDERFYRNKLEFTFSNKRWLTQAEVDSGEEISDNDGLGFHIPAMFDKVVDVKKCYLQDEPSNSIRLAIKEFAVENGFSFYDIRNKSGLLRTLTIRTTLLGEVMVIVIFGADDLKAREKLFSYLNIKFPNVTSWMYIINEKANDSYGDLDVYNWGGRSSIFEEMEGLKFKIGPKSFFQTNSKQAYNLYKIVRDFAALKGDEIVYDLYTGTGTIANFVAGKAKNVVGIEYVPEAIEDAVYNSKINNISNTSFFAGDIKELLTHDLLEKNGFPDVVITDPPRSGMHADVVHTLLNAGPQKIVYVSCNSATQARDINILDVRYRVTKIQPVDMFPHTHHVENVVLLERR